MNNELKAAKTRFVGTWGDMASRWGINKTMARVHALLMTADGPLSAEDVMAELSISQGNANMNLRALEDWGLVRRTSRGSERKEFWESEQDVWNMCCRIARERQKREIEPVIGALKECIADAGTQKEAAAFRKRMGELLDLVQTLDFVLGKIAAQEKNAVMPKVLTLLKAMS